MGWDCRTGTVGPCDEEWYYCVEHGAVEPRHGCRITNRLGPYPTPEAAARALEKVERRNQAWEDDPAWTDETEDGAGPDPEE